jgi:hypothetical protein
MDEWMIHEFFIQHNDIECIFVSDRAQSRVSFDNLKQHKNLKLYINGDLTVSRYQCRKEKCILSVSDEVAQKLIERIPLDIWQQFIHAMFLYIPYNVLSHTFHLMDVYGEYDKKEDEEEPSPRFYRCIDMGEFTVQRFNGHYWFGSNVNIEPSTRYFLNSISRICLQDNKARVLFDEYINRCNEMKQRLEDEIIYFTKQIENYNKHF